MFFLSRPDNDPISLVFNMLMGFNTKTYPGLWGCPDACNFFINRPAFEMGLLLRLQTGNGNLGKSTTFDFEIDFQESNG